MGSNISSGKSPIKYDKTLLTQLEILEIDDTMN